MPITEEQQEIGRGYAQELCHELRLPDEQAAILQEYATPWTLVRWAVSVFSEGERRHSMAADVAADLANPAIPLLLGPEGDILVPERGWLAGRVLDVYGRSDDPDAKARFENIAFATAQFMGRLMSTMSSVDWRDEVPTNQQVVVEAHEGEPWIVGDQMFDNHHIDGPAESIVTFGPGMGGAMLAERAAGLAKRIYYVSHGMGGLVVNRWIAARSEMYKIARRQEIGQEPDWPDQWYLRKGIVDGGALLTKHVATSGQYMDVVLMSAVHSAGAADCQEGVRIAHDILRGGGRLVLKLPDESIGSEGGLDVVNPVAQELFGEPLTYERSSRLGGNVVGGEDVGRSASFVVYRRTAR